MTTTPSSSQLTPTAIIVRNHSGMNFASASLSALPDTKHAARAFGELAPIPNGSEQIYGRATRAAPLPNSVEFRLTSYKGQVISQQFQLNEITKSDTDLPLVYVLVFEIQRGGIIEPSIEPSP